MTSPVSEDNRLPRSPQAPRPHPPVRRRRWRWSWLLSLLLTVGALLALTAMALIQYHWAERHLLTLMLTYAPQVLYVAPVALLATVCLGLGQRGLGLFNLLLTAVSVVVFMRPVIPWQRPAPPPGATVRVVTWNVHEEFRHTAEISLALADQQPDIICLQESRRKPFRTVGGPHMARAHKGELTTVTSGKIVRERSFLMAETPNRRYALETVIDLPQGRVTVLNVHFHSFHSPWRKRRGVHIPNLPEVSRRTRETETQKLLAWVAATPGPKIIAGDFNTPPQGLIYRRLSRSLTNAFVAAGSGLGYTYRRNRPILRIDHIWVADGPQPVACRVVDGGVSDHLMLLAEVALPPRPAQGSD